MHIKSTWLFGDLPVGTIELSDGTQISLFQGRDTAPGAVQSENRGA